MSRLNQKCLVASMIAHGSVWAIMAVCVAFRGSDKVEVDNAPVITLISPYAMVTDGPTRGGNPSAPATARPAAQPTQQAAAQAAPPAPKPPVQVAQPTPPIPRAEPRREETPKPVERPRERVETKPAPRETRTVPKETAFKPDPKATAKPEKKYDFAFEKPSAQSRDTKARPAAPTVSSTANASSSAHKELQRLASTIGGVGQRIGTSTTSTTVDTSDMLGPGGGGQAFVNYAQFVREAYDAAWRDPEDVSDENATVKIEIVIRRDGSVISENIVSRSGISALDQSVQRALQRVDRIRPFPEGSTDSKRTFILKFNLKSKRSIG